MLQIIEGYCKRETVDAVLLGCTELLLMVQEEDISVPIINSTKVHIRKIFEEAVK